MQKHEFGEYRLKGCKRRSVSHLELLSSASRVGGREGKAKLPLAAEEEKVVAWEVPGADGGIQES